MDSESKWAKSTESRLEMFFDDYLIHSSSQKVRHNSQRLLLSLFKKGNRDQQQRILSLTLDRCNELPKMGRASQDFLQLVQKIFMNSTQYEEMKSQILNKIFKNLQIIYSHLVSDPNYEFYAFAANLINFGNDDFKPYLLEANGCLSCYGREEVKAQFLKLESVESMQTVFTNKFEIVFKRHYQIKDLQINLKANGRFRSFSVFYKDREGDLQRIGKEKYKQGETIPQESMIASGLLIVFQPNSSRRSIDCVFCGNRESRDETNYICSSCMRRSDKLDLSGTFKVVGANPEKLREELCVDFGKLQNSIGAIKDLHARIHSKQKINLHLGIEEMASLYDKIVNNLSLLNPKNSSRNISENDNQKKSCFSCYYYEIISIFSFIKTLLHEMPTLSFVSCSDRAGFQTIIKQCLKNVQIESLRINIIETLARFVILSEEYEEIHLIEHKADFISEIIRTIKAKKATNEAMLNQNQLKKIVEILVKKEFLNSLKLEEKIKIFVSYFLDWDFLLAIQKINSSTEINRLTINQVEEVKGLIDFDLSGVFTLCLDSYLKAFLLLLPEKLLPKITLNIQNSEFLQYLSHQLPEIQEEQIKASIIHCPNPIIKLNMFSCLPTLVNKLSPKDSMKIMNKLFPYKKSWNLNVSKACKIFKEKLETLTPEEQIYSCLSGYAKSKDDVYIEKLHKLFVPQRMKFIIKLDPPQEEIERMQIEYPFISIREVRSDELQGDTIKALHDWIYEELAKNNHAMPLDIIVEKNIIDNMDLPIEVVYQNIAENKSKKVVGDQTYEYFRVIYRVQGILGEPKQRSIGNPRDQKLQTCIAYSSHFLNKFSEEFKSIGLDVLIQILEELDSSLESQSKKILLFEILSTLSLNEAICKKIVEGQYGDSIINATVRLMSFENQKDAKITNFLLELSAKVIDEANQEMINLRKGSRNDMRKYSGMDIESEGGLSSSEKKVKFVLERFRECEESFQKSGNKLYRSIAKRLIKLLPFCSKDQMQSSNLLFNFFQFANWAEKSSSKLDYLFIFMESLSESYMTFKKISHANGVSHDIIKAIIGGIRKNNEEAIDQRKFTQNKNIVEPALLLLCALVQGDEELQKELFQSKLFHNIYEISQIPPKKSQEISAGKIPENCYKIIKYFGQGRIVALQITDFLAQRKRIEKEKLAPKKNKKWEMMKNKQKKALEDKMEEAADEKDAIICSTCQEGYSKRKDILGLYIYQTKNQIPNSGSWWKEGRKAPSFTSSTYFTAIHYDCHMKAFEADQKIPRSEWDGALIRNMDVLCNSWIPFKGPKTTSEDMARTEKKYFEKNKNGNYWNIVTDLNGLLDKLSRQFDFATESKGSSSLHNFRYIPILMGFAIHFMEKEKSEKASDEGLAYLLEHPPKKLPVINLFLCYSLFHFSFEKFESVKKNILKWIVQTRKEEMGMEPWFIENKSHLVYLKLIEQLFLIMHKKLGGGRSEGVLRSLDYLISNNLQELVQELDLLNDRYKGQYTKYMTIEEFGM